MRATVDRLLGTWRLSFSAPVRRSLMTAWKWWVTELAALVPRRARRFIMERRRKCFLQIDGTDVALLEGFPGQFVERGRWPLRDASDLLRVIGTDDASVVLVLSSDQLLTRSIELPAGAEEDLASVLELEMDRQTPFPATQVYYDFAVRARSAVRKTVTVDLVLTPRALVERHLAALLHIGISPVAIDGIDGSGKLLDAQLLPAERGAARQPLVTRLNALLALTTLVLLGIVIGVPILKKQSAIAALEPRVASAMESAREGSRIRENIERLTAGTNELIERREIEPTTIGLLDELTRILPDHAWVERIEIDSEEIDLHGQSDSAAAMIALLESSGTFREAQFRSPVTQVPGSDWERFHISVVWKGDGNDRDAP